MGYPERLYLPHNGPQIALCNPLPFLNYTEYRRHDAESIAALADIMRVVAAGRAPDFIIGEPERPYLRRWWLVPRNEYSNIYLHNIVRDDDDRALHDHPWDSTSIILSGELREILPDGERVLRPGSITSRDATSLHRLELVDGPVWTLFITGPKVREWGFMCPDRGWVHWREFTDPGTNGATVGRGCGE